jgi:hypothetical protein
MRWTVGGVCGCGGVQCEESLPLWLLVMGGYGCAVIVLYALFMGAYLYYERRANTTNLDTSRLVYCCDELYLATVFKVVSFLV